MPSSLEDLRAALAGRYEIEKEIGQGGMATVYLAQDLKHDRNVAIKVLRPELAVVLGAERFLQEIKTTANLQHPHILPLFDSGEADGFLYYVMPYIEGETLRDKLNRETQLGIEEAVQITTDVADALDYAHRQNVIHRDIKPENILLHDGRPMVADFGIALAVSAAAGGRMTETGLSLGTPHYMSPEQATAEKNLTNRSDIYSLGCVLYEMLTGDPPHTGSSAQQIIMKIVTEEVPPVTKVRKAVQPNVAAATAKALEKLPADRFTRAESFARALADPSFEAPEGTTSAGTAFDLPGAWFWKAAAAVSLLAAVAVSLVHFREARPSRYTLRYTISLPSEGESEGLYFHYNLSPDGQYVAVSGVIAQTGGIFVRALNSLDWRHLSGTSTTAFFWSPDSRSLGFFDDQSLKRVGVDGDPVQHVAEIGPGDQTTFPSSGSWSRDGVIVFSPPGGGPLMRVPAAGGEARALTTVEPGITHRYPAFMPDGQHFLFTSEGGSNPGIYVASLGDPVGRRLLLDRSSALFAPPADGRGNGHLIFVRDGRLMAQPFDSNDLELQGDAFVLDERALWEDDGAAAVSVSANGILTYLGGRNRETDSRLVWFDRSGAVLATEGPTGPPSPVSLSPDGRLAAVVRRPPVSNGGDVWLRDLDRGLEAPFTFDGEIPVVGNVVWSPDGSRIAFSSASSESVGLYIGDVTGSGTGEPVIRSGNLKVVTDWSREGYLLYTEIDPETGSDLWYLRLDGDATGDMEPVAFRQDQFDTSFGQISPDGQWIAYVSNETGGYEVWVQPFPSGAGRWRLSESGTGQTQQPRWSRDGSELFYTTNGTMMAAPVRTRPGPGVSPVGDARPLFKVRGNSFHPRWSSLFYDVSDDGERFLISAVDTGTEPVINVVVNWEEIMPGAR